MKTYQISTQLHSFCKTFENDLTKPQTNRFKELLNGIIRGKKAILSEVARQNRNKQNKSIRKQVEQYSNMLPHLPLQTMLIRKLIGFRSQIKTDTPLYFDLVDITKKYYKSMDQIGTTWNGSEGIPGKGYEMVDVSLGLPDMGMTLYRNLYSTDSLKYESQVKEIEEVLKALISAWGEIRGTCFVDAGGDNNYLIELFLKYMTNFVIRMNVNRGKQDRVIFNERGDKMKMMEIWDNEVQGITGWHDYKNKKQKLVKLKWRKIFLPYKKELVPLCLVWCHREGDPDPCVFLTSRTIENAPDAEKVYRQYFERGGKEETVFKCHKDKMGMEKVQLCSIEKVKQLMLVYVLADQLLAKMELEALTIGTLLHTLIKSFLKGTQRKITKWSIIDFYDYTFVNLERDYLHFKNRFWPHVSPNQLSLSFNLNEKW